MRRCASAAGRSNSAGAEIENTLLLPLRWRLARILVVEDEPTIATTVAEWLGEVGHKVIGPADDIESALVLLAEEGADVALIDVSLAGAPVGLSLAEMLRAQRVPFAFLTGYSVTLFPVALREYRTTDCAFEPALDGSIKCSIHSFVASLP